MSRGMRASACSRSSHLRGNVADVLRQIGRPSHSAKRVKPVFAAKDRSAASLEVILVP